jgi:hypothetical protein
MTAKKTVSKKTVKKAAKRAAKRVSATTDTLAAPPRTKKTIKKATKKSPPPRAAVKTTPLKKPSVTEHSMPEGQIIISRIATETIRIWIVGMSPLITHKFSEKAKRAMLDAMQGRKAPKEPKDPEAEYRAAAYRLDDGGYGLPAIAFKSATVSAARFFGKSVSMVGLRQTIFVAGEFSNKEAMMLARINGEPWMREDVVRVGNGGTDLRYRPCWTEWSTSIDVTFVKSMLTRDSVISLVEAGGLGVGVGEWRPEKKGEYGTFTVDPNRRVEVL